jgi:hypothetical protein
MEQVVITLFESSLLLMKSSLLLLSFKPECNA